MLNNQTAYKYEMPYRGPFVMKQCFTNDTVMLEYGAIQIKYNIHRIKFINMILKLKILIQ